MAEEGVEAESLLNWLALQIQVVVAEGNKNLMLMQMAAVQVS